MHLRVRPLIIATALVAGALAAVPASAAVIGSSPSTAAVSSASSSTAEASTPSLCPDADTATFGPNVCVFTPAMTQAAVQADLNAIATQQVPIGAQFDSDR
jgi:hypothetical protein